MAGNRRHAGGMRSAMQNLKKYDAVHDLSPDERKCALCQTDPVEANRLSMPLHADWCPEASRVPTSEKP